MDRYSARELIAKSPDLSRGARLLYTILDEYARGKANCFRKHVTLMGQLKCSKRSLQYWLAELTGKGFISIQRSKTGGVNVYHLAWIGETVRNEAQSVAWGGCNQVHGGVQPGARPSILNTSLEYSTDELRSQNQNQKPREAPPVCPELCRSCGGKGQVFIHAIGWATCTPCYGSGRPRTVSFGAKAS